MALDIIILAAIAGFLIYRLYLVLGQRNEPEQTDRPDPYARKGQNNSAPAPSFDRANSAKPVEAIVIDSGDNHSMPEPVVSLDTGLKQIAALDPYFDEKGFANGARAAFQMIIKAYAAGDLTALKPLLSDDLYHSFANDIRARQARGEQLETTIHEIKDVDITQARVDRTTAIIGVRYISQQSSITRDQSGQVIHGDNDAHHSVTDHWVYARNMRSQDPNWQLTETLDA